MPVNAVPTLSTFGYTSNVAEKIDFLLAHFCYSDKLQTTIYGKNVASLQWIIQEKVDSMIDTVNLIRTTLKEYFTRYFESATIDTNYTVEDPDQSQSKVLITVNITVVQDNIEYQVDKVLRVLDGRFKEFVQTNNG